MKTFAIVEVSGNVTANITVNVTDHATLNITVNITVNVNINVSEIITVQNYIIVLLSGRSSQWARECATVSHLKLRQHIVCSSSSCFSLSICTFNDEDGDVVIRNRLTPDEKRERYIYIYISRQRSKAQ